MTTISVKLEYVRDQVKKEINNNKRHSDEFIDDLASFFDLLAQFDYEDNQKK
jgi:hypothetical protein